MRILIPEEEEDNEHEYISEYWRGWKDFQKRTPRPTPWGTAYGRGYYAGIKAAMNWSRKR